jgi:hypothetical protein
MAQFERLMSSASNVNPADPSAKLKIATFILEQNLQAIEKKRPLGE